jgi:glutaredoxin 3
MMYKVYTKPDCPYCVKAKSLLKMKGLGFTEVKIGTDVTREFVMENFPSMRSVPIITKDDVLIGGYTQLEESLK